nr:MAG: hypothetical protein [uncultured archaeon]
MFEYDIPINHSYGIYIFVIDNKEYKILYSYKKRFWLILKNNIKTFFSNLYFKIKFYKLIKRVKNHAKN